MAFRSMPLLAAANLLALTAHGAMAQEAGAEVGELVVTGAPYAVSLESSTTSVNIMSRAELDTAAPAGLGDVLNGLPGLRSTFHGPGASRPIIRGLSGPRVLILQNGVGLVDASLLSPDHAVASEPGEAWRIEVLRGPSTLAYGGSAIGGVVNILDQRIAVARPDGLAGRVAASAASTDDSYSLSGAVKLSAGPAVLTLDGLTRESHDYAAPGGTVANSWVELRSYGAGLSRIGEDRFAGVSVKRTETDYGVPFAVGGEAVFITLAQTRYDLRGEQPLSLGPIGRLRFSVGHADYEHSEIERQSGEVGTTFRSRGTEGRVELIQPERGRWQGAFGVQGLTRELEAFGEEAFVPAAAITEAGGFILQRLDRQAWGIEGGVRLDRRTLKAALRGRPTSDAAAALGIDWSTADPRPSFTNASASAAVFVRPAEHLFASLALAHNRRAPTEFELFADGPHAGTGAYEIGDPRLKAEQVTSLEATMHWTGPRTRIDLHAFASRFAGYIDQIPTGAIEDDLPVYRFAQAAAEFSGGEIEVSHQLWRNGAADLTLEAGGDMVRGATALGPPARIPPWSANLKAVWSAPRLTAEIEARRVGAQRRTAAFETATGGYTSVRAKLTYKPGADGSLRLFIEGRNLTDEVGREHASFLKDVAPLPGRSVRGGMAATF